MLGTAFGILRERCSLVARPPLRGLTWLRQVSLRRNKPLRGVLSNPGGLVEWAQGVE
jgi:hypothetical protein